MKIVGFIERIAIQGKRGKRIHEERKITLAPYSRLLVVLAGENYRRSIDPKMKATKNKGGAF